MIRIVLRLFTLSLLLVPALAAANDAPKGRVALIVDGADVKAGEPFFAALHFTLQKGWHIYWQNPGDSGLAPTAGWTAPEGVKAGAIHWPAPTRIDYGGLFNYGYEDEVTLLVPLTLDAVKAGQPVTLRAKVDWLVCHDICIPESAEIERVVVAGEPDNAAAEHLELAIAQIPEPLKGNAHFSHDETTVTLAVSSDRMAPSSSGVWWFPIDDGIIGNDAAQSWRHENGAWRATIARGNATIGNSFSGTLRWQDDNGTTRTAHVKAVAEEAAETTATEPAARHEGTSAATPSVPVSHSLWGALLAAFLGGLILNIMPCVLPILSLKALGIAKKAQHDPRSVRRMGVAYLLGILVCFALIGGALIGLQQAGESVGWGFQLQSPAFVAALCYVMLAVGLNLSGAYELPNLLGNAGHDLAHTDSARGSFFTGALAALVATPCTAPFMATALGFALGQPPAIAMSVFLMLGFGLAFPYLLISFVPLLHRHLPKPGAWMNSFRQFLAFPIYATLAWLLWVLVQQSGPAGLAHALSGLCLLAFGIWLLPRLSNRFLQGALLLLLAGFLITTLERQQLEVQVPVKETAQRKHYSAERLNHYLDKGTPVFVHATAAWCITCKVNEKVAIETEPVQEAFRTRGVMHLVADWTNRDEAISRYLASFGRNGVPIYVFYPPRGEPVVLPQVLTPSLITDLLDEHLSDASLK